MEINFEERQIICSTEELQAKIFSSEQEHLLSQLFSVMAYPEDAKKQELYMIGLARENLGALEPGKEDELLRANTDLLLNLYRNSAKATDIYCKPRQSRQKGHTGALYVRGLIAGGLLNFLVLGAATLDEAYTMYIEYCANLKTPIFPSKSLLKNIWREYYSVAPLWTAYILCHESPEVIMGEKRNSYTNHELNLSKFLQVAMYFRNSLVETMVPSTGSYLIKDIERVWNYLANSSPIRPAKIFTKN